MIKPIMQMSDEEFDKYVKENEQLSWADVIAVAPLLPNTGEIFKWNLRKS